MYKTPQPFERLIKDLKAELQERDTSRELARLLAKVELSFELLDILALDDEPIVVLWVLLSASGVRHSYLESLTPEQNRALANARMLLPDYAGRSGWEEALRDYIRHIPRELRCYDFDTAWLEKQIFHACRTEKTFPGRQEVYRRCLVATLPFSTRSVQYATADGHYAFTVSPQTIQGEEVASKEVEIKFDEQLAALKDTSLPWFTEPLRERGPITVRWDDLKAVAQYIDQKMGGNEWCNRLAQITYRYSGGEAAAENPESITFDGFTMLAGMVSSGKSTLMILLAAHLVYVHIIRKRDSSSKKRITLVVGDSTSSILLADKLNQWFCSRPEQDTPIAVPLLGRTMRNRHLSQLHGARDYQQAVKEGRMHWGERFLNPACPLQGLISHGQLTEAQGLPLVPGKEPCNRLQLVKDRSEYSTASDKNYLCPLFAICPSQQVYRDMAEAQVWITTPGAMGAAALPAQLESRPIRLGDLIYEQSHIVVFDEADTVMEWFDRLYAQQTRLTGNGEGVLDQVDPRIARYWSQRRLLAPDMRRWIEGLRNYLTPIDHILALLQQHPTLRLSVERGYFTSRTLFYRLSRCLLGLREYEDERDDQKSRDQDQMVASIMPVFERLMDDNDPLSQPIPPHFRADRPITFESLYEKRKRYVQLPRGTMRSQIEEAHYVEVDQVAYHLILLMQQMMNTGDSTQYPEIHARLVNWIQQLLPDIETRLEQLHTRLQTSGEARDRHYLVANGVDTLETLAYRLEFAMNVALLDRYTRLVFYNWDNRPTEVVPDESPYRRVPSTLLNILPLPPTGRLFGIYHTPIQTDGSPGATDVLSTFGYTNIGRKYVTEFHRLRTSLDGKRGPNVLAMSGTSYLPDSTRWHLNVPPTGVLKPHKTSIDAIQNSNSWFKFMPVYGPDAEPLRISGRADKREAIRAVAAALVGGHTDRGGRLGDELRHLNKLAEKDPENWDDRDRLLLLVNSYDQCNWAADELRRVWNEKEMGGSIYHLERTSAANDGEDEIHLRSMGLERVDVELFAQTNGKVLIAPLQSIGRGFNILNKHGKAAFGAVYFLTRPMPHPNDIPAIAQELNRRMEDWFEDEAFIAWQQGDSIYQRGVELRRRAAEYWQRVEQRSYYSSLYDEKDKKQPDDSVRLHANPRRDLAATTAGTIIQAVGRVIRGGVPFHAYFVDAAWAPQQAKRLKGEEVPLDTPKTSLLAAIIDVMSDYVEDPIGRELYKPLFDKLEWTENFDWTF